MRLICPACGAMCSAEGWQNDAVARSTLDCLLRFPNEVRSLVLPYLGLFRTGKSGLTWPRAYRLAADLLNLVEKGSIAWDGAEERPAPPILWQQAIDAVMLRRPKALANHNYLRHTAWEMASPLAARREREQEAELRGRDYTVPRKEETVSEEERAAVQRQLKEFSERFGR